MSRLNTIIRLRKWELDEKQRQLAILLGERDEIADAIEALSNQVSEQSRHAGLEVASVTLGSYIEAVRIRQGELADMLFKKEKELRKHQDVVAEGFRELKTFEIARDRELSRLAAEEAKQEQAAFDELGIQNHAREEELADPSYSKRSR